MPTPTELLQGIIQLAATFPDPHVGIFGLRAMDFSRLGGPGPTDGMPFRLDTTLDFWDTDKGDMRGIRTRTGLRDWAATWALSWWEWADNDEPKPAGDTLLWLLAHIGWASEGYPAFDEFVEEITYVRSALLHVHGLDPIVTDQTCPSCGTRLHHRVTDHGVDEMFGCGGCGNSYSPEGLAVMTSSRISASDKWVSRETLAKLLGVSRHRIRVWINRGQLEERDGAVSIAQARDLVRATLASPAKP